MRKAKAPPTTKRAPSAIDQPPSRWAHKNAVRRKRRQALSAARKAAGLSKRKGCAKKVITPEMEKVLYKCASRGFTQDQIADILGISERTLGFRLSEEPHLAALIKRAKADTIDLATGKLVLAIRQGAPWAICFFLKCRAGWRERLEVTGEVKHTVEEQFAGAIDSAPKYVREVINQLSPAELSKVKAQYTSPSTPLDKNKLQ